MSTRKVVDKVFSGKTAQGVLSPIPSLRDLVRSELYVVVGKAEERAEARHQQRAFPPLSGYLGRAWGVR